jgi:putative membrane protein
MLTPRTALRWLRRDLSDVGQEPDPRFSFANERTFLAWARTGLALIGGGLVAAQVLDFKPRGVRFVIAVPAILLGGLLGIASYGRWQANERALRLGQPLGYSTLTPLLAVGIVVIALIAGVSVLVAAIFA